jgi:hypothetical protein
MPDALLLCLESPFYLVMPGLVPGIHVLPVGKKDVDGRDKPGHDGRKIPLNSPP